MITKDKIKSIPKYIEKLIHKLDKKDYNYGTGHIRFYSYLTKNNGELTNITVATKNRYNKWYCKQVAVHGIESNICYIKDIEYSYIFGYVVGWYDLGLSKEPKLYESEDWIECESKYYNPSAEIVNLDYVYKFKKFKYCAVELFNKYKTWKYLKTFLKYPQAEFLLKMKFYEYYVISKQLLQKIAKDKKFRKWLINHHAEIHNHYFYVTTILQSYKQNKPMKEIQQIEETKKQLFRSDCYDFIKKYINKNNLNKFCKYINNQNISYYTYKDYLQSCEHLNIDLSQEKNLMPKDFVRWHDIRIDEYNKAKILADKKQRKELYENFKQVANKYLSLQRNLNEDYVVVIAKSPGELIKEGKALDHCVGRMNYDQKFAREESLIFFIRNKEDIDKPFVTMEYSLKTNKILQCYAKHNRKPEIEVQDFVNKKWLPYANRKLKKLVA